MSARAPAGAPAGVWSGAWGVLLTLCLALLLVAGRAPYDWAWARGLHATPAQWQAHERSTARPETKTGGHHDVRASAPVGGAAHDGTWLAEAGHEAHRPPADGLQAGVGVALVTRLALVWRPLRPMPAIPVRGPAMDPPDRPPRLLS